MSFRRLILYFKNFFVRLYVIPFLFIIKLLIRLLPLRISLVFDSRNLHDGLGAQMQRFFSVYSLAKFLNLKFYSTQIEKVSIHPFDGIYTDGDYTLFLERVNAFLRIDDCNYLDHMNNDNNSHYEFKIESINMLSLFCIILKSIYSNTFLLVENSYPIIDFYTRLYKCVKVDFGLEDSDGSKRDIAIHYRVGAGGKAIYPGQKIPRETDLGRFIKLLRSIKTPLPIQIFTDSPKQDTQFKVPPWQREYWLGTPRYEDGVLSIQGLDLEKLMSENNFIAKVKIGGDPLETILEMSRYTVLISSKSSMSYTSGILAGNNRVYLPKDFWHSKLPGWKYF